jgi:hypothetical protein
MNTDKDAAFTFTSGTSVFICVYLWLDWVQATSSPAGGRLRP